MYLLYIPLEILEIIINYLSLRDVLLLITVSRRLHKNVTALLWYRIGRQFYSLFTVNSSHTFSYLDPECLSRLMWSSDGPNLIVSPKQDKAQIDRALRLDFNRFYPNFNPETRYALEKQQKSYFSSPSTSFDSVLHLCLFYLPIDQHGWRFPKSLVVLELQDVLWTPYTNTAIEQCQCLQVLNITTFVSGTPIKLGRCSSSLTTLKLQGRFNLGQLPSNISVLVLLATKGRCQLPKLTELEMFALIGQLKEFRYVNYNNLLSHPWSALYAAWCQPPYGPHKECQEVIISLPRWGMTISNVLWNFHSITSLSIELLHPCCLESLFQWLTVERQRRLKFFSLIAFSGNYQIHFDSFRSIPGRVVLSRLNIHIKSLPFTMPLNVVNPAGNRNDSSGCRLTVDSLPDRDSLLPYLWTFESRVDEHEHFPIKYIRKRQLHPNKASQPIEKFQKIL
jgi:hypothetical protein